MKTILTILLILSISVNYIQYVTHELWFNSIKKELFDSFKVGWGYGVNESQTALKMTKDLSNRDKVIYWDWMQKRASIYGINLEK